MSRLQELIAELCPEGVEHKALGELGAFYGGLTGKSKKDFGNGAKFITYNNVYGNPAVDLEEYGLVNVGPGERQNSVELGDVLFTISSENREEAGLTSVMTVDPGELWYLNSFCTGWRLHDKSILLPDFLKHVLRGPEVREAISRTANGVTRFNISKPRLAKVRIPVPPIEVQREVVRILDEYTAAHDELVRQLEEEMQLRQQQLSIARNELFMLNDVENVAWVPLSELAEIGTGSHDTKDAIEGGKYVFYARGVDPLSLDEFDFDEVAIITAGDGAGVGKVFHYVDGKYALHQRAYRIHPVAKSILPKYLLHYFKATFYPYIMRSAVSSSVTSIRRRMLDNYMVPVPPLEQQRLLVGRLDEMEALSNAMSSELQSQLSLEREQLALVRNQLLSFPEKEA